MTPNTVGVNTTTNIGTSGSAMAYTGSYGVRPACNLSGDMLVSDTVDIDGCYTVIFDDAPIITAPPSGDLGKHSIPLQQKYTVTDQNNDLLTITEKLNGTTLRTISNQPSGAELTYDLTTNWSEIEDNITQTASIEVSDGIISTTRTWSFTKEFVEPISRNTAPALADLQPTSIKVGELSNIVPQYKAIQVFVTNNALDDNPVWEDATESYLNRKEHIFVNKEKTSEQWATAVKHITIGYPAKTEIIVAHEIKL